MSELYLSSESPEGVRLSIAPITSTKLSRCVETPIDTSGYFLTEEDTRDPLGVINILARIEDDESAFRLGRMFAMT